MNLNKRAECSLSAPLLVATSVAMDGDLELTHIQPFVSVSSTTTPRSSRRNLLPERESTENAYISLHQAARDGKFNLVQKRLQQIGKGSKKINAQDQDDTTALHYAVRYNHFAIVQLLLEYGANVNAKGENDASPLHYAARFRQANRTLAVSPGNTPHLTPSVSHESIPVEPEVKKKDEQKKENNHHNKSPKANNSKDKDRRRESLGNRLFKDLKELKFSENKRDLLTVKPRDKKDVNRKDIMSADIEQATPIDSVLLFLLTHKANVNSRDAYGSTPLHYAVMKGSVLAVKELLTQKNIDIEAKDKTEMTPLHCAASQGSCVSATLLIEHGADLRSLDEEQMTPLHFAAMEGNVDVAQLLFRKAEEKGGWTVISKMVTDQDREEQTALHLAVEGGHLEVAKLCIDKGANVNAVKANLMTPLHLASTSGHLSLVRMLIEHEANLEAKNALQETPLHKAASFNRLQIVEYLIKKGANIECRDKDKDTPLLVAASKNHVATLKFLLSKGADVTAKDSDDRSCIFRAADEGCIEALKVLLEDPNSKTLIEDQDKYEYTALHVAAQKGYLNIAQLLLDHGACIDAKNNDSLTPLHLAAKFGKTRIVSFLLRKDPSIINDEDDASNTPLHLAALEGHTRVVKQLLDMGALIDARNNTLWTPLDCAAAKGCANTAEALLDADSPVDPIDKAKTTPLHLACKGGHVEMVKLLLSWKADITLRDNTGRNCLDMAIENNHKDVAFVLINNDRWREMMRNRTKEGGIFTTPMRKLIKKLPEVAERVFNRCFKPNNFPVDNPKYSITLDYEFLDDVNMTWMAPGEMEVDNSGVDAVMYKIRSALPDPAAKQLEMKSNHPLMLMVTRERVKLLSHPLVTFLLKHKWKSCGRYVYYSKLILYGIFLFFLTGYAMVTAKSISPKLCEHKTCVCNITFGTPVTPSEVIWRSVGQPMILIIAFISILLEIVQLVYLWRLYLRFHRVLELAAYIFSITYVLDEIQSNGTKRIVLMGESCHYWHNSLGAAALYLSWISLALFMRKFPKIGIYVVMFTDILKTFAQFFIVLLLFVIAFGLGFHILIHDQKPFSTPGRSMLKLSMGMLGEYEYDTVYNDNVVPPITWLLYIMFLISNCIIMVNLLVGLAVDDIKGVQEKATLTRLAMQVDLALDVEKALPRFIRKKVAIREETVYPNSVGYWNIWSFWNTHRITPARSIIEALNPEKTPIEILQRQQEALTTTVSKMKIKMQNINSQSTRLEAMMKAVLQHHGIKLEEEVAVDDEEL